MTETVDWKTYNELVREIDEWDRLALIDTAPYRRALIAAFDSQAQSDYQRMMSLGADARLALERAMDAVIMIRRGERYAFSRSLESPTLRAWAQRHLRVPEDMPAGAVAVWREDRASGEHTLIWSADAS